MSEIWCLTRKAPGEEARIIFEGTEFECFARFLKVCPFSWTGHRKYSNIQYKIERRR